MKKLTYIHRAGLLVGASALMLFIGACAQPKKDVAPAGSSSAAVTGDGPRIELVDPVHDFGTVTEGDKVSHTFTVKNTGKAPLEIKRVRSSCGCTAAVTKEKEVAPGASTEIEVTFNTRGRMGPNRKTITIQSNDEKTPNAKLEIKAMIERLLAFQPTIVRLNVGHNEEKSVEAWLTGKLAKDAKLAVGEITGDTGVKVELAEKKEGEETKKGIRFTLKGMKVGRGNGTVKITTGIEKVPELTVRFNTTVMGNVEMRPRALYFDNRSANGKERVLRVTSKRDDFKLTAAKVLEGPYEAKISKPETGAGFEVRVTLKAGDDTKAGDKNNAAGLNGKLQLVSNDPLEPKLEVPLHVRRLPNLIRPRPGVPVPRGPGKIGPRPMGPGPKGAAPERKPVQ
jgi:Protein of unknown function (DUF1573)